MHRGPYRSQPSHCSSDQILPPLLGRLLRVSEIVSCAQRDGHIVYRHRERSLVPLAAITHRDWSCRLSTGCSVRASGVIAQSPGKAQGLELQADTVELIGACDPEVLPHT